MCHADGPATDSLADHNLVFQIVNLYYDEWKYRHENYWKRLIQFSIVAFFTTTLPITFRIFDNLELPDIPLLFFPVAGAFLALLCLVLCLSENARLVAVDRTIHEIIEQQFGFVKKSLDGGILRKVYTLRIGIWFPVVLTVLQITLAALMAWIIVHGKL